MAERQRCQNCGRETTANGPQGLCLACLQGKVTDRHDVSPSLQHEPTSTAGMPGMAAKAGTLASTDGNGTANHVFSEQSGPSIESAPTADLGPSDGPAGDDGAAEPGTWIHSFGDYEIRGELGSGTMGVVYKARQISLNRLVALKMIRSGALAGRGELRRFQNEAEAVARLDHPHIVPIHEVGEHDGRRYFSMKLIGGPCLSGALDSYTTNPEKTAKLLLTIAEAVHHAHQRGILHRDLKPSNILLDEQGQPHVSDFGLAKQVAGDDSLTESGAVLGTPAYMAPEQAAGSKRLVTTLSDVYGLGAVLYALLTGKPPFGGDSALETLDRVRQQPPVLPSKLNLKVPRDLEVICLKCLDKDPQGRYASAAALAAELQRFLAGEPILARPASGLEKGWRWCRRRPVIAGLAAALAVAILGGLIGTSLGLLVAIDARRKESEQTELARKRFYDSQMNLVQRYWESNNEELLQQALLEQHPVNQGGIDRRGFKWFYWQRRVSTGHITLGGHTGSVRCVAFSPDGKRIAAASDDGTVKVWDVGRRLEIFTLKDHSETIASVAFSPDGKRIAAVGRDETVNAWDAATGKQTLNFKGQDESPEQVVLSPDGKRAASAALDGRVKVWDVESRRETLTRTRHTDSVTSVAFSLDGKRVASAAFDGTVKVWDTATGQETVTLKVQTRGVTSMAFSPNGKQLASASNDQSVKIWDLASGDETLTLTGHTGAVTNVIFSPDGKRIASGGGDCTVRVWDAATAREILTLKGHNSDVTSVTFDPNGEWLASGDGDGIVKVWDSGTARGVLTLKGHSDGAWSVAFSPDGERVAAAGSAGYDLRLMDSADQLSSTPKPQRSLIIVAEEDHALRVRIFDADGNMAVDTDQERLAEQAQRINEQTLAEHAQRMAELRNRFETWRPPHRLTKSEKKQVIALVESIVNHICSDDAVKVWDAESGQETFTLRGHAGSVAGVALRPDGRQLASVGWDGAVKVWDTENGREMFTLKGHIGAVYCVAFSPDGRRLASAGFDQTVKVWNVGTGQEIFTLKGHGDRVWSVAFSPDGKRLASASQDRAVKLWETGTGRESWTIEGHADDVRSVAFSPDGKRLASGSADRTVKMWDAATGKGMISFRGHTERVSSVAFSPDGKRLASASDDRTLKVWDADTGQETLTLTGHTDSVVSVAFSPGGKRLASASSDGTVRIWDARPIDAEPAFTGPTPR